MKRSSSIPAILIVTLLSLMMVWGCRSKSAEQIEAVRLSGDPDSARTLAISLLLENSNRMAVWREFVRSTVEEVRLSDEDEAQDPLQYLIQAGLVAGTVYQHANRNPDREWFTTGRMAAIEVGRRINRLTGILTSQMQAADYLERTTLGLRPVPGKPDPAAQLKEAVQEYRDHARDHLVETMILRRLIEALPESSTGSAAMQAGQIADAAAEWAQTLKLESGFTSPLLERTRQAMDAAFGQAMDDMTELGYFLPNTILENGVIQ